MWKVSYVLKVGVVLNLISSLKKKKNTQAMKSFVNSEFRSAQTFSGCRSRYLKGVCFVTLWEGGGGAYKPHNSIRWGEAILEQKSRQRSWHLFEIKPGDFTDQHSAHCFGLCFVPVRICPVRFLDSFYQWDRYIFLFFVLHEYRWLFIQKENEILFDVLHLIVV